MVYWSHVLLTPDWYLSLLRYSFIFDPLGTTNKEISHSIINDEVQFPSDLNLQAKALISRMLTKNRNDRIKMLEILQDPWLFPDSIHKTPEHTKDILKTLDAPLAADLYLDTQLSPKQKVKRPDKYSKYYVYNYMVRNSMISKAQLNDEGLIKKMFEKQIVEYQPSYFGIVQDYVNRSRDDNVNILPIIKTLHKL